MSAPVMAARPIRILLVEDSATQVVLVRQAVKESPHVELIGVAPDGEEAIAFVRRAGKYENSERPDLILLDLNMPKKDGFQVLEELSSDVALQSIPVILFTTSDCDEDIAKSYAYGATTFITKPSGFNELQQVLDDIGRYWSHAKLPRHDLPEREASFCG